MPKSCTYVFQLVEVRLGAGGEVKHKIDVRAGFPLGLGSGKQLAVGLAVEEIGHRRGHAALRGVEGFTLILGHRFGETKMQVRIDQPWEHVQARGIDVGSSMALPNKQSLRRNG